MDKKTEEMILKVRQIPELYVFGDFVPERIKEEKVRFELCDGKIILLGYRDEQVPYNEEKSTPYDYLKCIEDVGKTIISVGFVCGLWGALERKIEGLITKKKTEMRKEDEQRFYEIILREFSNDQFTKKDWKPYDFSLNNRISDDELPSYSAVQFILPVVSISIGYKPLCGGELGKPIEVKDSVLCNVLEVRLEHNPRTNSLHHFLKEFERNNKRTPSGLNKIYDLVWPPSQLSNSR